ncbi:MAG: hypothetical protein WBO46_04160 [Caldilineaceae bacterium]
MGLNVASKLLVVMPEFAQILGCMLQVINSNWLEFLQLLLQVYPLLEVLLFIDEKAL